VASAFSAAGQKPAGEGGCIKERLPTFSFCNMAAACLLVFAGKECGAGLIERGFGGLFSGCKSHT